MSMRRISFNDFKSGNDHCHSFRHTFGRRRTLCWHKLRLAWFITAILSVSLSTGVTAQSISEKRADSIRNILKTHPAKDTTWIVLQSELTHENAIQGNYQENFQLIQNCLPIADSLGFTKGAIRLTKELVYCYYFLGKSIDSALAVIDNCKALTVKSDNPNDLVDFTFMKSILYSRQGDYKTSLDFALQARDLAIKANYRYGRGLVAHQLGNIYHNNFSDYNTALKYFFEGLKYKLYGERGRGASFLNIGVIFVALKDYQKANEYYDLGLNEAIVVGEKWPEMLAYKYKGQLFFIQEKYDSSFAMFSKGLRLARNLKLPFPEAECLFGLGRIYAQWNNYGVAMKNFRAAEQLILTLGSTRFLIEYYYTIAMLYRDNGKPDEEKYFLNRALAMAPERDKATFKKILAALVDIAEREHDYQRALNYQKQISTLQDSIFNEQKIRDATLMEAHYQVEQKEKEIELLQAQNLVNEAQIVQENLSRRILVSLLFGVGLVVALVFVSLCIKVRANHKLQVQNRIIVSQSEKLKLSFENLQTMQNKLIHAEKMSSLGQMTAGIAHEINNPLNFISGSVASLNVLVGELIEIAKNRGEIPPGKAAGPAHHASTIDNLEQDIPVLLTNIANGVKRVSKIVSGLLTFSRPQSDESTEVHIHECLETVLTLLQTKVAVNKITVDYRFEKSLPAVKANKVQLEQVFANIIDNAIQAMESQSAPRRLTIVVQFQNHKVVVRIRDTGPGIPETYQAKIMEPFFTTKPVGKGTGLGLSISYGIINNLGGQLTFTSEPGRGTEFMVALEPYGTM